MMRDKEQTLQSESAISANLADNIQENEADALLRELHRDLLPHQKLGTTGKIWIGLLLLVCAIGLYAYIRQLRQGLSVTGMRDIASWGIYISTFVFFVAVSLVGSLISAILKLTNMEWRTPLTRISEMIALAAIIFAGIIIVVDMGRPDRLLNLFIYGRIQSPIIWDVVVITTYFFISLLLLYIPALPCIALCRDKLINFPRWKRKLYKLLSLGWKGTDEQYKIMNKCINVLAVLIIPVALSIHTVTSWLFATTLRPGWDSTIFGPYFVAGAFLVGAAAVIVAMYVFRKYYHLEKYITELHFDRMGKLLVMLALVYLYFNINEYMVPGYKMKTFEAAHLTQLFSGHDAPLFWITQIFGMILPIIFLIFKKGRKPLTIFIISIFVVIGAWIKRFLIVTPTLLHPHLPIQDVPEAYRHYVPSWEEWAITLGTVAGVLLVITIIARVLPIIPIWEVAKEKGINSELINK